MNQNELAGFGGINLRVIKLSSSLIEPLKMIALSFSLVTAT
jgi:hypothetical protein